MSGLVAQQAGQMLVCHRLQKKKSSSHVCSPIYLLGLKLRRKFMGLLR